MDKPRFQHWIDRLASEAGKLGKDVEKLVKDAAESPTGQQVKRRLEEVGPQVRKTVDELRPEAKKIYEQVAPEVRKVVGEVVGGTSRALHDLLGRPIPTERAEDRSPSDAPPNISPDAYRAQSEDSTRFEPAGPPDDEGPKPSPAKSGAKKAPGKRPHKGSGSKRKV